MPLSVIGMFADGTTAVLTGSTKTNYASGTPAVATVDSDGVVTAIGRGTSLISVSYAGQTINVQVSVVTGPAVTVGASPSTLWPPNGSMVPVTVSGTIQDVGGGIRATSARYAVTDAYGTIQPTGTVTLGQNGAYSLVVSLEASRRGNDRNGRLYTILVSVRDNSGNRGSASTVVLVPHD